MTEIKSAIVTGAGSGIGHAIACRLVREGYFVTGLDVTWREPVNPDILFERVDCDMRKSDQIKAAFAHVMDVRAGIDVLVNSAGVSGRWTVATISDEEWTRVLDINLFGTFASMREAAQIMSAQRRGVIINIASNRGLYGLKNGAPYAASKGAVLALTKSAALELAPSNVGVFAILPGSTDTRLLRGTRSDEQVAQIVGLNKPEHVADAILPLLSPDALAFNGACISISRRMAL